MKSIKPGRGPSGMSFIGSIIAIIIGVFWTVLAVNLTADIPFPMVGTIFPLFGVLFVIMGIVQAIYNFKNATGRNRYSVFDITDSSEEGDPTDRWIQNTNGEKRGNVSMHKGIRYCPYCGIQLQSGYKYCPECGKTLG